MSSNLRVDRILPSTGTEVGVGTATGSVALYGDVNIAGTLTYEDVTNIDSVGLVTARSGLHVTGGDVGIGVTNPTSFGPTLQVAGTDPALLLQDTATAVDYFGANVTSGITQLWYDDAAALTINTATGLSGSGLAERLRITSAGRLGVGLANPNSNLHVKGGSDSTDNLLLTLQSNGVASDGSLSTGLRLINSTADNSIHGADIRAIRTGSSTADLSFSLYVGGSSPTERLRITSDGKVAIGFNAPAVAGLSISNSSTNRGFEFDTGSGFDSTSCIRAYDRPTTAYKSLGLTGSDIRFGINDVEKVRINSDGRLLINSTSNPTIGGQTPYLYVSSYTNLDGLRIRGLDTGNTIWKDGGDMSITVASAHSIYLKTQSATGLQVTSGGQVATPLQPRFFARRSADQTNYDGRNVGGTWITYDVEDYDIGGNFANSGTDQGRFIAPVSGLYLFQAAAYKNTNTVDWSQAWFDIDGSRASGSDWVFASASRFAQNSIQIYLTAGQKIGFHPYNNASGNTILDSGNHTCFKGCLLG
jgi:hypothetical protein